MITLTKLRLNKANPRIIKDHNYKKLVQSIKEFPKMLALRPIVIDEDGTILGGNMRYRALLELGYKEVPDEWVRYAKDLTEEEKQRFVIEDNIQFGDWDWDKLANEWDSHSLNEWGLEVRYHYREDIGSVSVEEKESTTTMRCPKCGFEW